MGVKSEDVCLESWGDGMDNNDPNYSLMDINKYNNYYYFEGIIYWVPNIWTEILDLSTVHS